MVSLIALFVVILTASFASAFGSNQSMIVAIKGETVTSEKVAAFSQDASVVDISMCAPKPSVVKVTTKGVEKIFSQTLETKTEYK